MSSSLALNENNGGVHYSSSFFNENSSLAISPFGFNS